MKFDALAALTMSLIAGAAKQVEAQMPRATDLAPLTKMITVDGLTFPVVDHGRGPAVLLLHGFPDDRHLWRYQVGALVDAGFRVIAPDLRGFGDAPRPPDPSSYGIPLVIRDLLGILDALSIRRVQLVAHDWGAAVGWRLAADHPDRISRYAALSVGAPGGPTSIEQREKSWYMAFFRQAGTAEEQLTRNNWQLFSGVDAQRRRDRAVHHESLEVRGADRWSDDRIGGTFRYERSPAPLTG